MLQAQGIIPKRRPSVTTNTYDRPSPSKNDTKKGERRAKRRSITKEPSIVRQCKKAIKRDEVTRLRVSIQIVASSHQRLTSDFLDASRNKSQTSSADCVKLRRLGGRISNLSFAPPQRSSTSLNDSFRPQLQVYHISFMYNPTHTIFDVVYISHHNFSNWLKPVL